MNLNIITNYFYPHSILDIGANVGQFYNECVNVYPYSYYFLIEGNQYCESALKILDVNHKICLLSDTEKYVDFYVRKNELMCTGNSIYREKTPFFDDDEILTVKIKTETLDSIIQNKIFDLIKLDVQGSEVDIIKGGLNLFRKAKGVIMEVSLVEYNINSPTKDFVIDFMKKIGFLPKERIGTNSHPITHEIIQEDILFINSLYEDD